MTAQGLMNEPSGGVFDEQDRARFREREKQVKLAQRRGEQHIGGAATQIIDRRRAEKEQFKAEQRRQHD